MSGKDIKTFLLKLKVRLQNYMNFASNTAASLLEDSQKEKMANPFEHKVCVFLKKKRS